MTKPDQHGWIETPLDPDCIKIVVDDDYSPVYRVSGLQQHLCPEHNQPYSAVQSCPKCVRERHLPAERAVRDPKMGELWHLFGGSTNAGVRWFCGVESQANTHEQTFIYRKYEDLDTVGVCLECMKAMKEFTNYDEQ